MKKIKEKEKLVGSNTDCKRGDICFSVAEENRKKKMRSIKERKKKNGEVKNRIRAENNMQAH